jgi:hypothetical protein
MKSEKMSQTPLFVKINDISKHLYCSICLEIFRLPVHPPCSHSFCSDCIKKQHDCPLCRFPINPSSLHKDLTAEKIINDLEVFCYNKKNCHWKGNLDQLGGHMQNCLFG